MTAGIFKFASHYFCHDLKKQGQKYIRHHFKQILQESGEFKDLLCDELEAILRDDELNVKNEEIVFDAVKTWVGSRAEERRVYLPRLLECIRYGLMTHKYFVNNIVSWKLVEGDEVSTHLPSLLTVALYSGFASACITMSPKRSAYMHMSLTAQR